MELTNEQIKELRDSGLNVSVSCLIADYCELCGDTFIRRVKANNKGGMIIPRYCDSCVEEHEIVNENYAQ